jgi:hypothetical protein
VTSVLAIHDINNKETETQDSRLAKH